MNSEVETHEQREVRRRVEDSYFPAWCAAQAVDVDVAAFSPDWSFLSPGIAFWFLRAIDDGVLDLRNGWPTLPDGRRTYLFERAGGRPRVYREGFLEVAAAGMLARRFRWEPRRLTFQSPKAERGSRLWAFDLLAYTEAREVAIAVEVKWRQADAVRLGRDLQTCGSRGAHSEGDCVLPVNHHRKYEGLIEHRPRLLWIVGPNAFIGTPDLVYFTHPGHGGAVSLSPAGASDLAAP